MFSSLSNTICRKDKFMVMNYNNGKSLNQFDSSKISDILDLDQNESSDCRQLFSSFRKTVGRKIRIVVDDLTCCSAPLKRSIGSRRRKFSKMTVMTDIVQNPLGDIPMLRKDAIVNVWIDDHQKSMISMLSGDSKSRFW